MDAVFKKIASWLFLIGVLVAVIIGIVRGVDSTILAEQQTTIYTLLAALGFVVGILSFLALGNITKERVPTFLIAALILVVLGATATYFERLDVIGDLYMGIAGTLTMFAAPAAGLLAIKAIWDAGKTDDIDIAKKITK
jgi:hypothetical protein